MTDASRDPVLDSICHLHIKRKFLLFSAGEYTGTGVLCKGRYILTAGHNVYQDRSSIASISIRCGTAEPMTVAATEIIDGRQGRDASNYPHGGFARDFGVIRLARPIAARASFSLAASAPAIGTTLYFAGYPDEGDPVHAPLRDGWHLHRAKDVAMANDEAIHTYDIRTFRSNSGGPVWVETGGQPVLVAIHVRPSGGRLVDSDFVNEVDRLIAELDRRAGVERPSPTISRRSLPRSKPGAKAFRFFFHSISS